MTEQESITDDQAATDIILEVKPSALRHGYSAEDAERVFSTLFFNRPLEGRDDVELVLGFSQKGDIVELFFEKTAEGYVVFHMMKCRKQYLDSYNNKGRA